MSEETQQEAVARYYKEHKGVWHLGYHERYVGWDEDLELWTSNAGLHMFYYETFNRYKTLVEGTSESSKKVINEPTYWDGKDTKDIEVGMIVMYEGESAECTVLFVASDKVVVDFNEVTTLHKDRLGSAQPSPRELAFTRFLSEWQKQSLDCAHDDASTVASLKKVFEFAYDTIVEEE